MTIGQLPDIDLFDLLAAIFLPGRTLRLSEIDFSRGPIPTNIALRRAKLRRRYSSNEGKVEPMSEPVIEAVAASNSLRAVPFNNTKRRLDGRERDVVGHHRLG